MVEAVANFGVSILQQNIKFATLTGTPDFSFQPAIANICIGNGIFRQLHSAFVCCYDLIFTIHLQRHVLLMNGSLSLHFELLLIT